MKPYGELTKLGRIRRLRELAQTTLEEYGLAGARLTYLQYEGNLTFRVDTDGARPSPAGSSIYMPNRYLLRILSTGNLEAVESELTWLAALSGEAGLPVPEPLPTLDGRLLTTVATPGVPDGKIISLMRWIDGRKLTKGFRPEHLKSWGEVTGRLHAFSNSWQIPKGFKRWHWDWEGQLGGKYFDQSLEELVSSMPERFRAPFLEVSRLARVVMEGLGKGPDAYGLIHADMYPENMLFRGSQAIVIDFEDCGYGYWMWDIAVALSTWPWTDEWWWMRDAFLEGYGRVRSLPQAQLKHLDLFMAVVYATMVVWSSAFIIDDPARRADHQDWREREGEKLLKYFERTGR